MTSTKHARADRAAQCGQGSYVRTQLRAVPQRSAAKRMARCISVVVKDKARGNGKATIVAIVLARDG